MIAAGFAANARSTKCEVWARRRGARSVEVTATGSVRSRSEDDAWIEVDLAVHEPAVDAGIGTGRDDRVEPFARRVRDRDEHDVRFGALEQAGDLGRAADDRDAVEAAAAQARVVVDEADD